LAQIVENSTEIGKTLLSAVGGVVAKAAERLTSQSEVVIGERRYRVIKEFAEGGFSKVFLVRDVMTGREYAMKQMLCFTTESIRDATNEQSKLSELRHRNIIELVGSSSTATQRGGQRLREFLFVFPYYGRGTVWDAIASTMSSRRPPWPFSERVALQIFLGSCLGIQEMHARGYAHWDIKVRGLGRSRRWLRWW